MHDLPVRDTASSVVSTQSTPRVDSVPPLSSTHTSPSPRLGFQKAIRRVLLIALPSFVALVARTTTSFEHKSDLARTSLNKFVSTHAIPVPVPALDPPAPIAIPAEDDSEPVTLEAQRARLFGRLRTELSLSEDQFAKVQAIFSASPFLGQGNPALSQHPITRAQCRDIRQKASLTRANVAVCHAPGMVPVFNPTAGQTKKDPKLCIDEFEFPNIPCEYPVVHVRANEAAAICSAIGKRMCDAHEWEGACAGALRPVEDEYQWGHPRDEVQIYHNHIREVVWSYGTKKNLAACGVQSFRSPDCPGGGFEKCGSNTYATGSFPECRSPFGVFDMHGNVAEHMNLPSIPGELGKNGGSGSTEMKGSWFAFGTIFPHSDDCRWRAPNWHETRISSESSHYNYHLGFRCCEDI
jgi:formylglycine-generating enzyme required for sulfatase activity